MKDFISKLFQITDPGRLAALKRIFGTGGSEVEGLKILAGLGVKVSDSIESIPYKIVSYIYGRKIPNEKVGNIANSFHHAAFIKEKGAKENGKLSFDSRFDALLASRDYTALKNHLIKISPFLDEHSIDYEILLRDLITWSPDVRDRWIETYYQPGE